MIWEIGVFNCYISVKVSLIKSSIFQNVSLKAALDLSLKPRIFFSGLFPRTEWMVIPPIFTADIPVGLHKRIPGFSGSLYC